MDKQKFEDTYVVILAGGFGTRFNEKTSELPKCMVKIGDKTVIEYIIEYMASFGLNNFIICSGYRHEILHNFISYKTHLNINCIYTGSGDVTKSNRILKVKNLIRSDNFFLLYSDDLSDLNINKLYEFHLNSNKIGTLTGIHPRSQFGLLYLDHSDNVVDFIEKPVMYDKYINAGYYIFNKNIFNFISGHKDKEFEDYTLPKLSNVKQLKMYFHDGNWAQINDYKEWSYIKSLYDLNKCFWIRNKENK